MDASRAPAPRRRWRDAFAHALFGACLIGAGPSAAADLIPSDLGAQSTVLQAVLDKSAPMRAIGPVGKVVVSQPEVAEVAVAGGDQIYVTGKALGSANLLVYGRDGRLSQTVDVRVGYDVDGLRQTLADAFPDRRLNVTSLSAGVLLEGEVTTAAEAQAVAAIAERTAPESVISRVEVREPVVRLEVRIAEINTRGLREIRRAFSLDDGHLALSTREAPIGVAQPIASAVLDTQAGDYRLTAALRALEDNGDAKVVAQPMLAVASGARGDFRAGGELPYPVPQSQSRVVVEFKPYGAGLKVIPTVQGNGMIGVQLEAELSEIDPSASVAIGGVQVPGLLVRRANTAAELRAGETLMIAGLLQTRSERRLLAPPWLERIPGLRTWLGSAQSRDAQRELAIFVTPHVARPDRAPAPAMVEAQADAQAPPPASPPVRTASHGPRGPPVKTIVRDLKQALAPPARWLYGLARRAWAALA